MLTLLQGDAIEQLATLPDASVQCCVTSPPYFGLRDYGVAGQIGLEPTPAEYVERLVAVFREVRRVLRDDGTLWLNLGDSYAATTKGSSGKGEKQLTNAGTLLADRRWRVPDGLKPKDLIGIPWRVAFALQADGWWLRQDIVWAKPNAMPESVRDRCTKAHEYVFLLSKSERYFYDADAISEEATGQLPGNVAPLKGADLEQHRTRGGLHAYAERQRSRRDSFKREDSKRAAVIPGQSVGTHRHDREESAWDTSRRNRRSVWTIATEPYPEAHFATFPTELPRLCILAGSKPGDTVLDPFNGSGTTGQVALELGRQYVGIELNPEYMALTQRRLSKVTLGLPLEAA